MGWMIEPAQVIEFAGFGPCRAISLQIDFEDSPESQAVILLARADGAGDRLGFSGADVWGGLHRQAGPAAVADAADGGAGDPQAHLRPFRRGSVRSLVENPYFQYFCGEAFFQHALVFDRSSLTRWGQRMGQEKLKALLQESLPVATRTDAMKLSHLACAVLDTTVQPKAVMFPCGAKPLNRARERP